MEQSSKCRRISKNIQKNSILFQNMVPAHFYLRLIVAIMRSLNYCFKKVQISIIATLKVLLFTRSFIKIILNFWICCFKKAAIQTTPVSLNNWVTLYILRYLYNV